MILGVILILLLAGALVALTVSVMRGRGRGRRTESGVASFRRHIDALSPEARREVMDRVRKSSEEPGDR
jgi:hypothetical protein